MKEADRRTAERLAAVEERLRAIEERLARLEEGGAPSDRIWPLAVAGQAVPEPAGEAAGESAPAEAAPRFVRELSDRLTDQFASHETVLASVLSVVVKRAKEVKVAFTRLSHMDPAKEGVGDADLCEFVVPFSSPQRVAILNALAGEDVLPTHALSEKTGLVGGQLYHHLKELLRAGLVTAAGRGAYALTEGGLSSFLTLSLLSRERRTWLGRLRSDKRRVSVD